VRSPKLPGRLLLAAGLVYLALSCALHGLHDHSQPGQGHAADCRARHREATCLCPAAPDPGGGPRLTRRCCQPPLAVSACPACQLLKNLRSRPVGGAEVARRPARTQPGSLLLERSVPSSRGVLPGAPRAPPTAC
jgi:hypothetical protein